MMAKEIIVRGKRPRKGKHMNKSARWRLVTTDGRQRQFTATLIQTLNFGSTRLAIFSVPKRAQLE
jgi:hypothetical protein